jgi:tRNA (guanine26-N2/guanine27-N2)-dimethyltransferase
MERTTTTTTVDNKNANDRGIHILDALAASGLRSIRYWKEVPGVHHITINDLDPAAVERAHANMEHNHLTDLLTNERKYGIRVHHGDATQVLYQSRQMPGLQQNPTAPASTTSAAMERQYDVIDLDPYGSAAPFLDGAVQAICDGGMLNITCTDMAALGGSHPETCFGRYGSLPVQRAKYLQEAALRIVLKSVAETAAKYGRTIRPILSVGMDFYVRCFVEIYDDKAGINDLSLHIGSVFQSTQCSSFMTVPHGKHGRTSHAYQCNRAPSHCEETGGPFKVGGPLWLAPIHNVDVVQEALARLTGSQATRKEGDNGGGGDRVLPAPDMKFLATRKRLEGLLTSVSEELPDVPLYYTLPDLCHFVNCTSPTLVNLKAALCNAGYRVSGYQ